ncbi:hypothetical protein GCM10009001_03050 [Virgibacillus siamensis]|uniref:Uncharacterized protein n=1 Tax=Virgibacillus siamensis TaxID=480071 RepID=A0ABP3QI15_9BACI
MPDFQKSHIKLPKPHISSLKPHIKHIKAHISHAKSHINLIPQLNRIIYKAEPGSVGFYFV